MGYTDVQIANWMILADSDLIHDADDVHDFKLMYKKLIVPKKHDFKVYITNEEIEYINKIKTTKENKGYLLAFVCYLKLMKVRTKRPVLKALQSAYIYYLAFGTDDYWRGKYRKRWIEPFMRDLWNKKTLTRDNKPTRYTKYTKRGPVKENIYDSKINAKWIDWEATEGYCIENPEVDVKMLVEQMLKTPEKVCSNCGRLFEVTPRTKTDLCPECWSRERNIKKHGEGIPDKEAICSECGKTFIKTAKTQRTMCEDCYKKYRKAQKLASKHRRQQSGQQTSFCIVMSKAESKNE